MRQSVPWFLARAAFALVAWACMNSRLETAIANGERRHRSRSSSRRSSAVGTGLEHRGIRVLRARGQRVRLPGRRSGGGSADDGAVLHGDPALRGVEDPHAIRWSRCGRCSPQARLRCRSACGCFFTSTPRRTASDSGSFCCAYGSYAVFRRDDLVVRGSTWRDAAAGALGGLAGGLAGLSGSFVTIWCSMRGWDKLRQRAVYQPFILVMQVGTLACLRVAAPSAQLAADGMHFVPFAVLGAIAGSRSTSA